MSKFYIVSTYRNPPPWWKDRIGEIRGSKSTFQKIRGPNSRSARIMKLNH